MPRRALFGALVTILVVALGAALSPAAETGFLARSVDVGGVTYRYQVFVPVGHTPAKKWPVVLYLHGAGERGDDGVEQTTHGLGPVLRQHGERFPAVVVFPQCRRGAVWMRDMERQALAALDRTLKEFNGDDRRVYLTGSSLGAYGAWQFAARHPERFAAVVPVAGGVVPAPGFRLSPEDQAMLRSDDPYAVILRSQDPYAGVARLIGKTPVWVFHGENDSTVPVAESRRMVDALRKAGGVVKYTEYPGMGHSITAAAYGDADLPAWLFAQRKP